MKHIKSHPILEGAELYLDNNEVPKLMEEVKKDISIGKIKVSKRLQQVLEISGQMCIDNPNEVLKLLQDILNEYKILESRVNYFDKKVEIIDKSMGEVPWEFETLVMDFGAISNDHDTVRDMLQDIVDLYIEEGSTVQNRLKNLLKQYAETVDLQ